MAAPPAAANEPTVQCEDVGEVGGSENAYGVGDNAVKSRFNCTDPVNDTSVAVEVPNSTPPANTHLKHKTISACVPDQLGSPDFGSCGEQVENFCPEGSWIRAETVDTRAPEDSTYGRPLCWTGSSPAGGDGAPPLSLDEVRTLLVLDPEIRSDNAGRGVRNAETNFYADAQTRHLVTTLNGVEVELRATPVSYHWDYGDGTPARITTVAGESQPDFDVPTPTSHVFEETGEFTVSLTTVYIGEYREAGGEWVLIPGTLTLASAPVTADIWKTVTRNVADDCGADATAWGCTGPIESPHGG